MRPSLADAQGSGSRRRYSYRDLLELKVIKNLLDAGIKLETVRERVRLPPRAPRRPTSPSAHLVIRGSVVLLCDGDELIDVRQDAARACSTCSPLDGCKDEIDAARAVELRSRRRWTSATRRRAARRRPLSVTGAE